jgi:hypothetical protein
MKLKRGVYAADGAVENVREASELIRCAARTFGVSNRPVFGLKERAHFLSRSHPALERRGISPIMPLQFIHTFYNRRYRRGSQPRSGERV